MATERWRMRCGGVVRVARDGFRLELDAPISRSLTWYSDGRYDPERVERPFDLVERLPDEGVPLDAAKCEDIVRRLATLWRLDDEPNVEALMTLTTEAYELVIGGKS